MLNNAQSLSAYILHTKRPQKNEHFGNIIVTVSIGKMLNHHWRYV